MNTMTSILMALTAEAVAGGTVVASADTYVRDCAVDSNYGARENLSVDGDPCNDHALLRFTVSDTDITRATLRLYATDWTPDGPDITQAGNHWEEDTVTWSDAPPAVGGVLADLGEVEAGAWVSVDVSTAVTGPGEVTFRLTPDSWDGVDFSSREGANPPELVLETLPATALVAEADSTLRACQPDRNLGAFSLLGVQSGNACPMGAVVRFEVDAPDVERATLRLYARRTTPDGPRVFGASNDWTESGVTWNDRPAVLPGRVADLGPVAEASFVDIDVSSAIDGAGSYSFVLVPDSETLAAFDSREGAYPPELRIEEAQPCTYPANPGGGTVLQAEGCFPGTAGAVRYRSGGAVSWSNGPMGALPTPAVAGDIELVAFGASHGGDTSIDIDVPFDAGRMGGQGFRLIAVRGEKDKKVELWARTSTGASTISSPDLARAYNLLVLDGRDVAVDVAAIEANTTNRAGEPWNVPSPRGLDLNVLAYFGDDSCEVVDGGGAELVFNEWGFGDGDSLHMLFTAPGQQPPDTLEVTNHGPQGRQYVGIIANVPLDARPAAGR